MRFAVESVGAGWVSIAWADPSNPRDMIGATAVIGRMVGDTASVDVYDLESYSPSGVLLSSPDSPRTFDVTDVSSRRRQRAPCSVAQCPPPDAC